MFGDVNRTITLPVEPPQIRRSSFSLSDLQPKKSEKLSYESVKKRLRDMLVIDYKYYTDVCSEDAFAMMDRIYLVVNSDKFQLNTESRALLTKRIDKLKYKKLKDPLSEYSVRKPVVDQKGMTWDLVTLEEYAKLKHRLFPDQPVLSLETLHPHELVLKVQQWAEDFRSVIDPEYNPTNLSSIDNPGSIVPPNENRQQDEQRYMILNAYAQAARFKAQAYAMCREMDLAGEKFELLEIESRETIEQESAQIQKIAQTHLKETNEQFEIIKNDYRLREEQLVLQVQQQIKRAEEIQIRTQEMLIRLEDQFKEERHIRNAELESALAEIDENNLKKEAVWENRIKQTKERMVQVHAETREMIEQAEARANVQRQIREGEHTQRLGNIESTHRQNEEILNTRLEEGQRRLQEVQGRNEELNGEIATIREAQRVYQERERRYLATIERLQERDRELTTQISAVRNTVTNIDQALTTANATNVNQKRTIRHLQVLCKEQQKNAHKLKKKAKKAAKKIKFF